jgi:hypothetical protein
MNPVDVGTAQCLQRLKAFLLPGGDDAARGINRIRLVEQGEIRSGPQARWSPLTAIETFETRKSGFVWEAQIRTAKIMTVHVREAFEDGHGCAVAKVAGVPVKTGRGIEFDKGEIQRYLASLPAPALVNHANLVWSLIGTNTLQLRDGTDPTGATVDFEIDGEGTPVEMRTVRPMTVGKKTVMTRWSAVCNRYRAWNGILLPTHREAIWHLPEGAFTYYRDEVTEISAE